MIAPDHAAFGIAAHDEFLSAHLASGRTSRLGLMKALCDRAGRYDLGVTGEAREVVDEFCHRRAPGLPAHHLHLAPIAVKALAFAILAIAGVYRWSSILSLVPKPYRSALGAAAVAAGLFFCNVIPRIVAARRIRTSEGDVWNPRRRRYN